MSDDLLDDLINSPEATIQKWTERVVSGRVGEPERRLQENLTENAQLRVQVALDRDPELGGKWRVLNNDKAFIGWLGEVDGFSGEPRQHLLTRAYNTGYSDRVAAIFKAFIASRIPQRERTETRLPHEGTGPQPTIRTADLARGKIWSGAEIRGFYRDIRLGKYDAHEGEWLKIEKEIIAAAREGRVTADAVQPRDAKGPLF